MTDQAFTLSRPRPRSTATVFASPHSGRDYPVAFMRATSLNEAQVRSSEDAFVDDLFAAAVDHGAPLLAARAPRAFLDLNRGADELDPAVISGLGRGAHNPRIASGLGVIPRVVSNGRPIYRGKIGLAEAHGRIRDHWRPYHDQLQALMDESLNAFGEAILIDCHSMPHEALESTGPLGGARPDVVLGDRFGASAAPEVVDRVEAAFAQAGFRVARNMPFAGAYICQHYGRPARQRHAVQIEIDRALYMDEATIRASADYDAVKSALNVVIGQLADIGRSPEMPMAAE
ncbi:N-formylglutamate amidohydrolase [Salibaculum sp.]|uniref:N-formylglutamate amidohydrolase n=1 Tax=Salibaculum sp. TaxID=2855480 RepID=UPI002B46C904|nr:N-formylglutamate amidohydrolase [Salibaculum sp.]HKL69055.1 N-formylglutamate amidohydrolase [Salibaculum sp.]